MNMIFMSKDVLYVGIKPKAVDKTVNDNDFWII